VKITNGLGAVTIAPDLFADTAAFDRTERTQIGGQPVVGLTYIAVLIY
jgi:hypothetical protein